MVRTDFFEIVTCEQLLHEEVEPAMCTSQGKNNPGRGTRKYKALELETDLVMF